ncbi:MAG: prepilin-type N-terminal cleavage/methylation domain-containing protein [Clostridium sp.]|nr:prepilin-type N-terminal cleavage/methylation domain-containing protein [Clostridium sp.]
MRKNRGFSLVELLVVVAVIAVIGGVLAPMLIRYVNKARLSSDIDTGKEVAKAIMAAVTEESVKDNAVEHADPHPVADMDGDDFKDEVYSILSVDEVKGKAKKDVHGNVMQNGAPQFYYTLDAAKNKVEVYYGGTDADYQVYPVAGNKLVE